jgi:hypothetical protein
MGVSIPYPFYFIIGSRTSDQCARCVIVVGSFLVLLSILAFLMIPYSIINTHVFMMKDWLK